MDVLEMTMPFEKHICTKADGFRIPIGGTIELLPICNMDCKMCYVRMTREQMRNEGRLQTADEWLEIIKQAYNKGLLFLLITGGEPFLYPEFKQLYRAIKEMGIVTCINTNGTLIDNEMADFLAQYQPRRVNISIYGASDERYGELCNNSKGFSQMMNAIHLLRKRNIAVKWNYSVTKQNVKDIEEIYQLSKEYDIPVETAYYMFPPARKNDTARFGDDVWLTPMEAAQVRIISEIYNLGDSKFIDKCNMVKAIKNGEIIINKAALPGSFTCRAGTSTFWINWKGEMTPCGMLGIKGITVSENGFDFSWENIKEWVKQYKHPQKCTDCFYETICTRCAASSYSEEHSFEKAPTYVCEVMEWYIKFIDTIQDMNTLRSWKENTIKSISLK